MMLPAYDESNRKRSISPLMPEEMHQLNLSDNKRIKMERQETSFDELSQIMPYRYTSQRSVPAFLRKLFNMMNDPSTDSLIHWSLDGKSFLIDNHEAFAEVILPRFYKHNTFASFVRQLNMYDFHKIPHVRQGVLIGGDDTANEVWEFSNPHFQRGREDLLDLVTRKKNKDRDETNKEAVNLKHLLKEISAVKKHQTNITQDLDQLRKANELVWKETLAAREKHQKHQLVIKKLLQLLTLLFSAQQDPPPLPVIEHSSSRLPPQPQSHSKSAIAIRQHIDALQLNVESLAGQLGIDPDQCYSEQALVDFSVDYDPLDPSKGDKLQLFRLSDPAKQDPWLFQDKLSPDLSAHNHPSTAVANALVSAAYCSRPPQSMYPLFTRPAPSTTSDL